MGRSQGTDLLFEGGRLLAHELQPLTKATNRRSTLLEEDVGTGTCIGRYCAQAGRTGEAREVTAVGWIDVQQQVMDLIAQAGGLSERRLPFRDQEVEHGGRILGRDTWQARSFVAHELGDGVGIQTVALARLARTAPALGGPPGVDLKDRFAVLYK